MGRRAKVGSGDKTFDFFIDKPKFYGKIISNKIITLFHKKLTFIHYNLES